MIEGHKRDRLVRTAIALSVWLLALAIPSQAQPLERPQDSQPPQATPHLPDQAELVARARALTQWVDDYNRWKRARDERDEKGLASSPREVRRKPDPPEWLFEDCRDVIFSDKGLWADACRLLTDWKDDALTAQIRRQITESRAQREAPTKTMWWHHVHLDTLWPMTQWGASVYGIVGTHATVDVAGRFQVFVTPGMMLLNVAGERGARDWRVATDWGVAYRLLDFKFPGAQHRAQLHVNLVTAWVFSGPNSLVAKRINLAGFSFTFKPPPAP